MTAQLLAGGPVAEAILADVQVRVAALNAKGVNVGLGTILVGDDGPSASYVKKKHETCAQVGMVSHNHNIPAEGGQQALVDALDDFNRNPEVHGYILQLPLPDGFDSAAALAMIDPAKDADGLHPENLGKLVLMEDGALPCTPAGIVEMLKFYEIDVKGKNVVVVGRGTTLGRPMALLLTTKNEGANAAVTVVHTGVPNIADYTREADIVIAAVGRPGTITKDMVKPGAVVVSGGISWEGKKLLPDVNEDVGEVASWITPRLGGVGPLTVAMLLANTVAAAERANP
ncbi:MAG: bifunctional 5,10-methylenetetrahydrofolate dehydrogenase/5,10-methenyltetrahydrofolate cyclohydrolase [Acidimicrobiales bacterium]|nr:bifunctional 5,10-methylenetetrahydrofolate dehydrogenase/5,10-methenyltetrahydrofolate cyclohydrolase [Acidimicrobiia bacterium]NNC81490.1 bifunctional 5,10-methylenetetrahydrofolate dehydrogenase/5,10-methenyltetrahydrofolate cyclohydrolase [Acidimicrobiales bacterium]RZV44987.1 MAG: bifunctional 5,10-methylenetetrahydrofolate dehydrogenase/5,10-methenyltetrahydrofolate cyclohydrolase [Acidimicrobiales bacterium]